LEQDIILLKDWKLLSKRLVKKVSRKIGRKLIRRLVRPIARQRLQAFFKNASVLEEIGK
jgi:hypothetical protein